MRYSSLPVVRGFLANRGGIDPEHFRDEESRAALLKEIRERHENRPICASVAIKVWQVYFQLRNANAGARADDKTVKDILKWMPLYCDATLPSTMVKVLAECGWTLHTDIPLPARRD